MSDPLPVASPSDPPLLEPTLVRRPDGRGALLTGGKPGNRGNPHGRTTLRTLVRASKNLEAALKRLEDWHNAALDITCPCGCGHTFTPRPTGVMPARDRIAYARLLAEIQQAGKGAEETPVGIVVATGSPADVIASATGELAGVELVTGEPAALGPGKPDVGPPERTQSGSARG